MAVLRELLSTGARKLKGHSETPFLDTVLVLSHLLGISKEKLMASYPEPAEEKVEADFFMFIEKIKEGFPVSYITHRKEFFGLDFYVDERVLIPRPDTETLVETAADIIKGTNRIKKILDLCTGSGCVGLSLKQTFPKISLTCADISEEALNVCRINSKELSCYDVEIIQSSLFEKISDSYDMILSNPPYISHSEVTSMMERNWKEPGLALDGGIDGLDLVKEIIVNAQDHLAEGGYLLLESAIDQTYSIKGLLDLYGYKNTNIVKDLTERNRVSLGVK